MCVHLRQPRPGPGASQAAQHPTRRTCSRRWQTWSS